MANGNMEFDSKLKSIINPDEEVREDEVIPEGYSDPLKDVTPEERKDVLDTFQKEKKQKEREETAPETTTADVTSDLIDTTKKAVDEAGEAIQKEQELKTMLDEGAEKTKEEAQKIAEEEAAGKQKLLEDRKAQIEESKAKTDEVLLSEKEKQTSELEAEKKFALAKVEAQRAQAALSAERAVREEKVRQRTNEVKFKMYLNRTGLANTGAGAYQAVQLANEGARAVAELQENAALTQAEFINKASELELEYTTAINDVTTTYNKNKADIDSEFDEVIFNIQSQKFTTSMDKKKAIQAAEINYLDNIRKVQSSFVTNVSNIRKTQQANQASLIEQFNLLKQEGLQELNTRVVDGTYFNLTDSEKAEIANRMGISLPDLQAKVVTELNSSIRALYDNTLGEDYIIGKNQMNGMLMEITDLMTNSSYSLQRALNEIVVPAIKDTQEYKNIQAAAQAEAELSFEEREADILLTKAKAGAENRRFIEGTGLSKAQKDQNKLYIIGQLRQIGMPEDERATVINSLAEYNTQEDIDNAIEYLKGSTEIGEPIGLGYTEEVKTDILGLEKLADTTLSDAEKKEILSKSKAALEKAKPYFISLGADKKDELEELGFRVEGDAELGEIYYDEDDDALKIKQSILNPDDIFIKF